MPDIANRLKAAREGLGLSQQAIAEHCGVTARSQRNYEAGERLPDAAYLSGLVELGIDVVFVLTGTRAGSLPTADPAELLLLENYRRCTLAGRQALLQNSVLQAAGMNTAKPVITAKPKTQPVQPISQKAEGNGNVQIGSMSGNYGGAPLKTTTRKPKTK